MLKLVEPTMMQQAPVYAQPVPQYLQPDPLCAQANEAYCRLQMLYGEIEQTKQYLNMLQAQAGQTNRELDQLQNAVTARENMQHQIQPQKKGMTSSEKALVWVGGILFFFRFFLRFLIPVLMHML